MTLPVDEIIRSRRKTLALIVKPDGSVLVRAPLRTPKSVIQAFVAKNKGWIETKQAQVLATLPPPTREYVSGQTFPYLGASYPLDIVEGQSDRLLLDTGKFKLAALQPSDAAAAFERWYREQARQVLSARRILYPRL